jgi:hypothetical protein
MGEANPSGYLTLSYDTAAIANAVIRQMTQPAIAKLIHPVVPPTKITKRKAKKTSISIEITAITILRIFLSNCFG